MWTIAFVCDIMLCEVIDSFLLCGIRGNSIYQNSITFAGATVQNGYVPTSPYTITVYENPYSFDNENWATLWLKSGGGDNLRPVKLRKKPSCGQWFLNDIQCLSEIRKPASDDPWA